ncbi:CPBP family intramembrane glutamic endopeptidase [Anaerocolumna xylanovorans]|uniref:CAAX prenyl protease 2/Lysostaphin resistance protein A-like domain-containing protein n=1 Tax=Anaerocolumna xylanovorans DSM 12503 TaxID=1121345 RepID=A0A1M7YA89_9FIRM|nr:type II CAAX endopeptidase family protein [Anaerocolumna xylanovorans]SHO49486.1 hypothetical protein SAMN02745217_02357 [Anaerocolumna xylanovorans DSM 12503]
MNQVKSVNRVFLATVLITFAGIFINPWVYYATDNYLYTLIISQFLLIIPSVIYLVRQKRGIADIIGFRRISFGNVVLLMIFTFLILPLMGLINAISMLFVRNDTTQVIESLVGGNGLIIGLIMVGLVPCIMEESVYRGVLFQGYRTTSTLKGILLSGLLFGLIHQNFNQFSYAFVMGVIFAFVIEATGSILSTMIIHFIINSTSVISLILSTGPNGLADSKAVSEYAQKLSAGYIITVLLPIAAVSTLLAFFVFRVLADNSGRWEHIKEIFKKKPKAHLITPSLVIGIVLCLIIMIANEYVGRINGGAQNDEGFVTVLYGLVQTIHNFFL